MDTLRTTYGRATSPVRAFGTGIPKVGLELAEEIREIRLAEEKEHLDPFVNLVRRELGVHG
jgi:hypothetical protein